MIHIGITGQHGFVGSHLFNRVSLLKDEFTIVPFARSFFDDRSNLQSWVRQCDVIVHLAALNRHADGQYIHDTNIELVSKLIAACKDVHHTPHILFSSSTQEEKENLYGQSKKAGRQLLQQWSDETGGVVTGLIIPNVFGPFGKPFYNSVVATFCHQLCHGDAPSIDNDGLLKLIYVDELVQEILEAIILKKQEPGLVVAHTSEMNVSQLLQKLIAFKDVYLDNGNIPALADKISLHLFNTFRSYIDHQEYFPKKLKKNTDDRGSFMEIVRLGVGGQVSYSTTHPNITRGNHFHTRKIERFTVIKGKAIIELRKYNTKEVLVLEIDGEEPAYVDMPIWFTHNIKNTGDEELYTVFWINEPYDASDPDTYFEQV